MKTIKGSQIPSDYWKAIVDNDASYDDTFLYGVKTTGIFCRPSCKSKVPNKENVLIFNNADLAQSKNFRPCKRCRPNGLHLPDEEWIGQIVEWIDQNYHEQLTLNKLAESAHGSPYHLQRTFKRLKGMTPLEHMQQVRISQAVHLLVTSDKSVTDIGQEVGLLNTAYFVTLFKKKIIQPLQNTERNTKGRKPFMNKKSKKTISWSLFEHENWKFIVAATSNGLCYVGSPNSPFNEFKEWAIRLYPGVELKEESAILEPYKVELQE